MADKSKTSLSKTIQTGIDSALKEVHTCLPAVVISVDNTNHLIDAQITIKRKINDELVLLPVLQGVPIRHLRASIFSITMPIKANDHVMILCSERSIDTWLTEGGLQNPYDVRKFSLSDAFAIPMMYSQPEIATEPIDADNLQIKLTGGTHGDADISITPKSDVKIRNDHGLILMEWDGGMYFTNDVGEIYMTYSGEIGFYNDNMIMWFDTNGYIEAANGGGALIKLNTNGDIILNDSTDFAVAYTDLKAAFDTLKAEVNALITVYNAHTSHPPGNGVPAVADMSGAKVPTVKVP